MWGTAPPVYIARLRGVLRLWHSLVLLMPAGNPSAFGLRRGTPVWVGGEKEVLSSRNIA